MSLLTQDIMFDFLSEVSACIPCQRFGPSGERVTTSLWEQGDTAFSAPVLDFHVFEMALSGQHRGFFKQNSETENPDYLTRVGAITYSPAGTDAVVEAEGAGKFQQLWIDRSIFDDVAADLKDGDPDSVQPLGFLSVFDADISRAMTNILREAMNPSAAASHMMIDMAAQQIAIAVVRRTLNRNAKEKGARKLSKEELQRAIDFIEDHIGENEGLNALARAVGMSPYYFARAFKEAVGIAPHQFLTERRVLRARDMLANSSEPIAGIAFDCGFSSQSHMTNIFAKHVGVSPAKYRSTVLN